jgi:hypothetical protein
MEMVSELFQSKFTGGCARPPISSIRLVLAAAGPLE